LISIILSANLKEVKSSRRNISKNISKTSIKIMADSLACYAAYTNALNALENLPTRRQHIKLTSTAAEAITAIGTFETECSETATKADSACLTFLAGISESAPPSKSDANTFKTDCAIAEPPENTAECYSAYETLVNVIQSLQSSPKKNLKVSPADEFQSFLTSCATTAHSPICSAAIKDILPAVGPTKEDLSKIQTACNVPNPDAELSTDADLNTNPTEPQGDSSLVSLPLNNKIILFILAIVQFYLMI
jgi:hypothetical protein